MRPIRVSSFIALIVVATTTIGASAYAPLSCGCVGPAEAFAIHFDIPLQSLTSPTPEALTQIRAAMLSKYRGRRVPLPEEMPQIGDYPCGHQYGKDPDFTCNYWLWGDGETAMGVKLSFGVGKTRELKSLSVRFINGPLPLNATHGS